jgi:outer membrane receptor protein involved in Fe transport
MAWLHPFSPSCGAWPPGTGAIVPKKHRGHCYARWGTALVAALLMNVAVAGQSPRPISVVVADPQGQPVPGATVHLALSGRTVWEGRTASDGSLELNTDVIDVVLTVTAPGFAPASVSLELHEGRTLAITLEPAPFFEEIQVTSSRTEIAQADPNVTMTVFWLPALQTRGAPTIDDMLKMVPGFALNRRSSSRVANPGMQSPTLRGLGGSGASRSVVLADGVPLNDPFAGWVYWNKVPQSAIDRVEVLRGGGSDLYGADAVGGVVQILSVRPGRRSGRALIEGGNLGTGRVSAFLGGQGGDWNFSGAGELFTTEGYIMVAEDERGPVDTPAGSTHRSAAGVLGYRARSGWRFEGRGNVFSEDRKNGTPLQVNDTDAGQVAGEVLGDIGSGSLSIRVFRIGQGYDETFSIISAEPPRASEELDRIDRVPTNIVGLSTQWVRTWPRSTLLVGGEGRFIDGSSTEVRVDSGRVLGTSEAGGTQRLGSAFVRATFQASDRLTLAAGARGDSWRSESLDSLNTQTAGSFSPRVSVVYRVGDTGVSVRGAVYGGFRAPTLNELYRGFRDGNDVTTPNGALTPERLKAGEGGVLFARGRASARVTGFWNVLDDSIVSVTLATSPSLNVRQRQNADKLRSVGVEMEGDLRLSQSVTVGITSAIVDARFTGNTSLRGYRAPQVANYTVGATMRYDMAAWHVSGQVRVTGPQYEDDLNTLLLRRATVVDLLGSRTLNNRLNIFMGVENLFDSDYDVGRTPARTVGLPRAIRGGLQVVFP